MMGSRYKTIVANILKTAQILNHIDKILFEPAGLNTFNMLWYVPSANENIRFGVLDIDSEFMRFLASGQSPQGSPSPKEAYKYLKTYDLTFNRDTFVREYEAVNNNLKILMGGDPEAINEFQNRGTSNISLDMTMDTEQGSPRHNDLLRSYNEWRGEGPVSEAIPHMAKIKQSIKISHRENDNQ